jgi:alpha-ribazole phosphatase
MTTDDPAPRRVYLLRHGHVETGGRKCYIGRTDLPLSSRGVDQAQYLARALAQSGAGRIVSSDLGRAVQTARIIAEKLGLTLETEPALREIDLGAWEGRAMADVRREDPKAYRRREADLAGFRPPGGESFADLARRVVPAFERIAASAPDVSVIVSHAGVNRVLLCRLLAMPLNKLFCLGQDEAAVNIIDLSPGGIVVRAVNSASRFR